LAIFFRPIAINRIGAEDEFVEPVSLIVTALVAGASEAVKDTAAQTVKDAYAGLRRLLKRRTQAEPSLEDVIDRHRDSPDREERLRSGLASAGVAGDEMVLRAAQRLLALIDPTGADSGKYDVTIGKYNVTISHSDRFVVGDNATIEGGD
jgi:hypothetical protein